MRSKWRFLKTALVLCVLFVCVIVAVSCSSGPYETEISRVKLKKDQISVTATLDPTYISEHKGGKVYLLAIPSAYAGSMQDYFVVGNSSVREKMDFEFSSEYDGYSLLTYAFVLAEGASVSESSKIPSSFTPLTSPRYVDNASSRADNSKSQKGTTTIKGLQTSDCYEAEFFGVQHIMFEADIAEVLLADYRDGAIKHTYNGSSYYFKGEIVDALDRQIEQATRLNMRIYLRTFMGEFDKSEEDGEYLSKILYCNGASRDKSGYLPNLQNCEAAGYIGAFYDFLASRYLNDDTNLLDFIIGSNVNNYPEYCNAGSFETEQFEAVYFSWLRSAYNVLSSHSSNVHVYVPVDNNWRTDTGKSIGSRTFLTHISSLSKNLGDFGWRVAFNLGRGDDLSALLSGDASGYSVLGVNELMEIPTFLGKDEMLYDSEPREAIIDSLVLPTDLSESNRAAYYTYAYYKSEEAGLEALFYNASLPDSTLESAKSIRSAFYFSFLMCGSNLTAQLNDYTGKIPNSKLPSFSDYVSRQLIYEQSVDMELSENILRNKTKFPCKFSDFVEGGSAYNADIDAFDTEDGSSGRRIIVSANASRDFGAITLYDLSAKDIIEYGYIGIEMTSSNADKAILIITDENGKNSSAAYVGEADLTIDDGTYYFKISGFTDHIKSSDKLNLSICIYPEDSADSIDLCIEEISLYGSSGNGGNTLLIILVVGGSILGICVLLFLLSRRRKKHQFVENDER